MRVVGVDGCRGGWLAAVVEDTGVLGWQWASDIGDLLLRSADAVAVDIPIGLPDSGTRACDEAARSRLGRRGVSVFSAPVRAVLGCATYGEARATLAALGGASMSAQAFGIVAAVRQADAALSAQDEPRVIEAHPEVAFATMAGGPALPRKRSAAGAADRLRLLARWRPAVLNELSAVPAQAPLDDALDALACAWVAQRWVRGEAEVLGDGARDARGFVMRIVT